MTLRSAPGNNTDNTAERAHASSNTRVTVEKHRTKFDMLSINTHDTPDTNYTHRETLLASNTAVFFDKPTSACDRT